MVEVDFSFRVWDIFLSRLSKDVCGLGGRLHVWASYPVADVVWESLTISATERLSRSIAVVLLDMAQRLSKSIALVFVGHGPEDPLSECLFPPPQVSPHLFLSQM